MSKTETFAHRLRSELDSRKLTQTELATRTDIDRSDINRLVNGKRDPRPQELGWISAALDIPLDVLLRDLDITEFDTFEVEANHARKVASRVLTAERERDEAKAELRALEGSIRAMEQGWRTERTELQNMLAQQRQDCAERLRQRDEELAAREGELLTRLSEARDTQLQLERRRRMAERIAEERQQQIERLQASLAGEKAKTTTVGLFAGLVGAALAGSAAAMAVSSTNDDDDDDDDDDFF